MKTVKSTLKICWGSAGSGPAPLYQCIEDVSGTITVRLTRDEYSYIACNCGTEDAVTQGREFHRALATYLRDNASDVVHGLRGIVVNSWSIEDLDHDKMQVTLGVDKFKEDPSDLLDDEDDGEWDDDPTVPQIEPEDY